MVAHWTSTRDACCARSEYMGQFRVVTMQYGSMDVLLDSIKPSPKRAKNTRQNWCAPGHRRMHVEKMIHTECEHGRTDPTRSGRNSIVTYVMDTFHGIFHWVQSSTTTNQRHKPNYPKRVRTPRKRNLNRKSATFLWFEIEYFAR